MKDSEASHSPCHLKLTGMQHIFNLLPTHLPDFLRQQQVGTFWGFFLRWGLLIDPGLSFTFLADGATNLWIENHCKITVKLKKKEVYLTLCGKAPLQDTFLQEFTPLPSFFATFSLFSLFPFFRFSRFLLLPILSALGFPKFLPSVLS